MRTEKVIQLPERVVMTEALKMYIPMKVQEQLTLSEQQVEAQIKTVGLTTMYW